MLYCGILPSSSPVPSFLLVSRRSPLASWLPVVFLFCPWCCSESEDSVINLRIQHSNCLWYLFDFLFPCTLSPSLVSLRYNLSSNSLYLHTLPTSKLHQQNRFFFVGSWPRHSCQKGQAFIRWMWDFSECVIVIVIVIVILSCVGKIMFSFFCSPSSSVVRLRVDCFVDVYGFQNEFVCDLNDWKQLCERVCKTRSDIEQQ